MKRLLPLVIITAVLAAASVGVLAATNASGNDQPPIRSDEGIDPNECSLVHNSDACEEDAAGDTAGSLGMCVEGAEECVDMIVVGDGQEPVTSVDEIDPNECSLVHNVDACEGRGVSPPNPGE